MEWQLLINKAKMVLRITTSDFDGEISDLVSAGLTDLEIAGIKAKEQPDDPLIVRAVMTYVKMHFGDLPESDYRRLSESYALQRSQLYAATGYTDWGDDDA